MYQPFRSDSVSKIVLNLIIINFLFYLASWVVFKRFHLNLEDSFALFYPESYDFRWYQMLTHLFMHSSAWLPGGSIFHILLNMYGLWLFGSKLEQIWGAQRFLLFYFISGAGAFLMHWLMGYIGITSTSPILGASGAISGLVMAYAYLFSNSEFMIMPIPIPIKAKYLVMVLGGYDLIFGLFVDDNIAHFAHIGGMLAGLALILYWNKTKRDTFF